MIKYGRSAIFCAPGSMIPGLFFGILVLRNFGCLAQLGEAEKEQSTALLPPNARQEGGQGAFPKIV
ncbi:hypothetical protein [Coxiella burnetii]|uniref:hypothetical protein n=1 Tax=Coxiella burnetii TaxID=777 RepID=UPI002231B3F1|nr:hypothetical protein [Coxiella burnetii]